MKKEIIAIVLALVMVMGMGTAAFAQTDTESGKTQTTTVNYTKTQTYTWSVPATITAGHETNGSGTVEASEVYIGYGKKLTIDITAGLSDGKITLTSAAAGNDTATATVTFTALTVNAGADNFEGSTTLTVAAPDDFKYAATYTGTLTFTATVGEAAAQN